MNYPTDTTGGIGSGAAPSGRATSRITIISYGRLHDDPPAATDADYDLRTTVHDPARVAGMLDLDGRHPLVRQAVLGTDGALDVLADAIVAAERPRVLAFACAGGKHRAPAMAEATALVLRRRGHLVTVDHRHIALPRVLRPTD